MHCLANIHGSQSSARMSTRKVSACCNHGEMISILVVLGSHARLFKEVFLRANNELMEVFGMQLVELPKAERVTLRQKRGAPYAVTIELLV